jgi:anaerobic selenocysteine-containing dehydrogenase
MSSSEKKSISRRKFLDLGVKGYTGAQFAYAMPISMISACAQIEQGGNTVHGVCYHDCPDSCSWTVTVRDGEVVSFGPNDQNPYTGGSLCRKMEKFPLDVTYHPDRLLTPLKRVGKKGAGEFKPLSWTEALDEVSEKLKDIIKTYGAASVLPFGYAGTQGLIQGSVMSNRFFARMGSSLLEGTICGATAVAGNTLVNGQTTGVLPEDIVHSRYIVLWGTNTLHSNVHLWPLIQKARKAGARLIVVDPFESATARASDWHIQPMPGTDVALALGMVHVIIRDNLHDADYIENHTLGFKELKEHVAGYSPEIVSGICDLPESVIETFAREYAAARPSLIRILIGMEHNRNGGDAFRAVAMLPGLTGAWKDHGGGLMHMTYELAGEALNYERINLHESMRAGETRSINMVELGKALTNTSTELPVRALFVYNTNPVVTMPNQNLVRKGMEQEQLLTVVLEHFMTDTARYADYVFPATTQLEHWDVVDSWGQRYINLNQPAISPRGESRPNSEFFRLLAEKMGYTEDAFRETDLQIAKSVFRTNHPYLEGVDFDYLLKHGWARFNVPEPWLPHEKGNFGTPSGKCEFYNPGLESQGITPLPEYKKVPYTESQLTAFPLQLLTIKSSKWFLNTSHANVARFRTAEGTPTLDISQEDAGSRGIAEGDKIRVFNEKGSMLLEARIGKRTRRGVVCLPQGYWPSLLEGGSSANALTSDWLADLGGGSALQDTRVEVEKA